MSVGIAKKACSLLGLIVCGLVTSVGTAGCEARNQGAQVPGFVTGWQEARQSLEAVLRAWRDCPTSTPLPASFSTKSVQFVDRERLPGQRLASYQILAQSDYEHARVFTVRLNLEGEESPQLVKYFILGRDPVWIYRLEDYEKLNHWEHDMSAPAP